MPRKPKSTEAAPVTEKLNWQTGKGYPEHGDKTRLWAWEFLRRNPKYRQDWQRLVTIAESLRKQYSAKKYELDKNYPAQLPLSVIEIIERAWCHEDACVTAYDPPRLEGETEADWIKRVGHGERTSIEHFLARQYGLNMMHDPEADLFRWVGSGWISAGVVQPGRYRDNEEFRWFWHIEQLGKLLDKPALPKQAVAAGREYLASLCKRIEARKEAMYECGGPHWERKQGKVVFEFDLSVPYMSQIEKAADLLRFEQEKFAEAGGKVWGGRKDKTRKLYSVYLRCLDALEEIGDERKTAKAIADEMKARYEIKKTAIDGATQWLASAKALRDEDYKKLVAIDDTWPSKHVLSKKKTVKKN